jgi:hypothetical protein
LEALRKLLITAPIQEGAVYYFIDPTFYSVEPHYFIVMNVDPSTDEVFLLLCSSSQIEKVKARRNRMPDETLVELSPGDYCDFTKDSIVDCNKVHERSKELINNKILAKEVEMKAALPPEVLERLRAGIAASPMVSRKHKELCLKT